MEKSQCPVCSEFVDENIIMQHVNACLESGSEPAFKAEPALPTSAPLGAPPAYSDGTSGSGAARQSSEQQVISGAFVICPDCDVKLAPRQLRAHRASCSGIAKNGTSTAVGQANNVLLDLSFDSSGGAVSSSSSALPPQSNPFGAHSSPWPELSASAPAANVFQASFDDNPFASQSTSALPPSSNPFASSTGAVQSDYELALQLQGTPQPTATGGHGDDDDQVPCYMCDVKHALRDTVFLRECMHNFCPPCLKKTIMKVVRLLKVSTLQCPVSDCTSGIADSEVRSVLSAEEYNEYGEAGCKNIMERLETSDSNHVATGSGRVEHGIDGKPISKEAMEHKAHNRFRCRECQTEFCAECNETPYHLGFTCAAYVDYKNARHCRFCNDPLPAAKKSGRRSNVQAFVDVCKSKECQDRMKTACPNMHPCGHPCGGVAGEKKCLPCLSCSDEKQTGDEFCAICYIEDINAAPSIKLKCGHIFHFECVKKKVEVGWPSSRITFTFMECPLCKEYVHHELLMKMLKPHYELQKEVLKLAMNRLRKLEQTDVKELTDPQSPYYNNPELYAILRFCYYPCFKCKKPYYGGEKACGAPVLAEDFDPKELICASCSSGKNETCKKHGKEYIEYKCKFCCSVAVFFCWGNTHFCDTCHKVAPTIAKKPRAQLPKCTCGRPHPPNGEEFCLGCSLCRYQEKAKKKH